LFVAGLPWPFPVAVDATAALGARPERLAWLPVLVALRCLWLLMLMWLAAPAGIAVRPRPAVGAVVLPALGAVPMELAGLLGGPLAAAGALAVLVAGWSLLAVAAAGARPGGARSSPAWPRRPLPSCSPRPDRLDRSRS
jgi:hypothetical protein